MDGQSHTHSVCSFPQKILRIIIGWHDNVFVSVAIAFECRARDAVNNLNVCYEHNVARRSIPWDFTEPKSLFIYLQTQGILYVFLHGFSSFSFRFHPCMLC